MKINSIKPPIEDSDLWHGTAIDGAVRCEWFADSLSVRVRRGDRPGSEVVYIRPLPEEMTAVYHPRHPLVTTLNKRGRRGGGSEFGDYHARELAAKTAFLLASSQSRGIALLHAERTCPLRLHGGASRPVGVSSVASQPVAPR
jgi:hypothetical protein